MAIDSANKRRSAASRGFFKRCFPVADGSITGVDKQHEVGRYRGVAAAAPVAAIDLMAAAAGQWLAGPVSSGEYLAGPIAAGEYLAGARATGSSY